MPNLPLDAKEGAREFRANRDANARSVLSGIRPSFGQTFRGEYGEENPPSVPAVSPEQGMDPAIDQQSMEQNAEIVAMNAENIAEAMMNPIEYLRMMAEPKEKPVSLETLTKQQKEKILKSYIKCRNIARNYYEDTIEPEILRRREIYYADAEHYKKVFPQLSELCEWCSKDVKTACDWLLPTFMEVFTGSDDPVSVKGVNIEDDGAATKMQQLIRYQLEKKNDYHQWVMAEINDALKENFGVAKVWWNHEEKHTPMEIMLNSNDSSAVLAFVTAASSGKIEVKSVNVLEEAPDLAKVAYDEVEITANHPVLEYVPNAELRFTPDASKLENCKFVAHRKIVQGDYLKRKERDGIFEDVDKALKEFDAGNTEPTVLDMANNSEKTDKLNKASDDDLASKEVELYEAYINVDYNNDGIFEKLIVHAVGDNLIRVAENDFDMPPFFVCSILPNANKVFSEESLPTNFEQIQDLKTAMIRQVIVNVTKNNSPRIYANEQKVDMDAMMNGEEVVPTMGNPAESIFVPASLPLSSVTMSMIEYAQNDLEAQSGSTRYNQGLDSNSLNKMLALDTPIPMADGSYKNNGDIIEGDMVIGRDGKPTKVLKAHPVNMPERAFKLTFTSGDVIKAGGEHRWMVKVCDKNYKHLSPEWEVLPTERIFDLIQTGHKVRIPRVGKVEYPEKDLPIDPYVFGLWLGDGNAHTNRFTTMDVEIKEAFENWAKKFYKGCVEPTKQQRSGKAINYQIKNTPFREMLKDLGVLKDGRYEATKNNVKHIPEIYLKSSFEQRLALLQGLMDTDGCISKDGQAVFCNSEPALVRDVTILIESLGGAPNVKWREVTCNLPNAKGVKCRPHCHITFAMPYCPVRIARKVERWKTNSKYWEYQNIVAIEEIPLEPMRCLTVEAEDSAYCCGKRFTITLNTATGVTAIMGASEKRNKLLARSLAESFFIPVFKFLIKLNQLYLEDEQVVRLTNESVPIRREELDIDYDLIVNVGQGAGTKEAQIQYYMYILNTIYPILAQQNVVNASSWYSLVKKLLEAMGIRDVTPFLLDPSSPEAKEAQEKAAKDALEMQAKQFQQAIQMAIAKSSVPRVSMNLTDMPTDAQQQYLEQMLGLDTTEQDIAEHEIMKQ